MAAAAPSNWGAIGEIIADFVSGKGPNVSSANLLRIVMMLTDL